MLRGALGLPVYRSSIAEHQPAMAPRRRVPTTADDLEWIGGLLSPPLYVDDGPESVRASVAIWIEAPSGLIVGCEPMAGGDTEGVLARVLLTALDQPLAGPPRRPVRLRVADASLAEEARAAVGDTVPVRIGPTPELDAALASLLDSMPEERSYLEGGYVSPTAVAKLFQVAQMLWVVKPWNSASDEQVLRVDVPAFGVDGACASILGALGDRLGFILFPSLEAFDTFAAAAEQTRPGAGAPDLGTGWLSVIFEHEADLPPTMRREVAEHGWPVSGPDAYPVVERWESDATTRPLTERDVEIAAACTLSLSTFCAKHAHRFTADAPAPICESYFDEHDLEVRITLPYEAFPDFELTEPARPPAAFQPRAGRNDPCPCGSGRKYKKCHLPLDEAEHATARDHARTHDLDGLLVDRLSEFALREFGPAWFRHEADFADPDDAEQLARPWSVYGFEIDGRTVVGAFLERHGRQRTDEERTWLGAQQAAWLSVWEVLAVDPGTSITLCDLLTGETREVAEVSGSKTLVPREALLARVVDYRGAALLCGVHPRPLPPLHAAEVVHRGRGRLRLRRAVPVERLRNGTIGRYLIRRWEEAVDDLEYRASVPPELRNTDGDPFLLTTDHFAIEPGQRAAVERRLATLEGVEPPGPDEDPSDFVVLRLDRTASGTGGSTVIGRVQLADATLRIETNSRERADALRPRVEAACGPTIRYRIREHADPLSSAAAPAEPADDPAPAGPEVNRLLRELKERHYATWPDEPLPALAGRTPRAAVRTADGRRAVDALLKDMEHHEHLSGDDAPFDFSTLRRQLRLE